jgi:CTP synthase (UTP-ammonia lyase)
VRDLAALPGATGKICVGSSAMGAVKVGIVGDFDRGKHSHWATEVALFHAGARLGVSVEPRWVSTATVAAYGVRDTLAPFDAIWGAPGSPYRSMPGILRAIEYARTRNVPYLGTCAGFQYALIELTRNVLGVLDADTAENASDSRNIVITPVLCDIPSAVLPRLHGSGIARPTPGSLLERLCGSEALEGEYFCSFETNPDFVARWQAAGLRVAARGNDEELRAFELPDHRFFVATLFQPQLSSSFERPHPLITGLLSCCAANPPNPP